MIVYMATNTKNGKVYICLTTRKFSLTISIQKSCARRGSTIPFHEAIRKYGEHNFIWQILEKCQSISELYATKEQYIIDYNSMDSRLGYNCTTGGIHFTMNDETCEKIRQSRLGFIMPEETRGKIRAFMLSNLNTNRGRKFSDEAKENMRLGQLNSDYVQSEESKTKTSETMKKRWKEPEVIKKMANRKLRDISGKNNPMYGKDRSGKNNPMYGKKPHNYGVPMTSEQKDKLLDGKNRYLAKRRMEILY